MSAQERPPVIETRDLHKIYHLGAVDVAAVNGVTIRVDHGEFVAIMGHSGSGKSTFMNLIGCLDRPTSGTYLLEGEDVSRMSSDQLAEIRNRRIGFVFLVFYLLARTSGIVIVVLPMLFSFSSDEERRRRALEALTLVGLAERADHAPSELSGGQQQRVAIARALVNNPSVILADEPTGNLDTQNSEIVLSMLRQLNKELGQTIIMITHNPEAAAYSDRVVHMRDGVVVDGATAD